MKTSTLTDYQLRQRTRWLSVNHLSSGGTAMCKNWYVTRFNLVNESATIALVAKDFTNWN